MARKIVTHAKPKPTPPKKKFMAGQALEAPDFIKCSYAKLVPIGELKPNPANPNKHTESQIDRFAEILLFTGVRKPIVVSKESGMIVTGHGTLQAIQKNGWPVAPVDYQSFENYDQEYAHIVADNALQQWSQLDKGSINAQLENLGPELNLAMFGLQDFVMDLAAEKVGAPPPASDEEGEGQWGDAVQSETVRKVVLFYSNDRYGEIMKSLMELSARRNCSNLSDLIAQLIQEALK